jgi:hypothetical protein
LEGTSGLISEIIFVYLKLKKMSKIIYIVAFISMIMLCNCKKLEDFEITNINPDATSSPNTAALLTNTLSNLICNPWIHQGQGILLAGTYCQYFSETYITTSSCYASNQSSPMWQFYGALYDLQNIIKTNSDVSTRVSAEICGSNADQIAIARILKAYIYWTITDCWGDIPYIDALKGNTNVNYDSQETIYKDLIKELTEAVAQFNSGKPIKGDIAYNGDIVKWKKLANSLRMLTALNLSKQFPLASDYSAIQFNAALADAAGSIESNEDNFQLNYPGGAAFRNPFYDLYYNSSYQGESATLVSILMDTIGNDVRQIVFGADINGNPSTLGVPYGRTETYIRTWCDQNPSYCFILAPEFRQETSPYYVIKASNVLLARAEAADRGWTTENTAALYQAGITASFTLWGIEAPDSDYFTKTNVTLGPPGKNLKQIAIQEYLAYFPDGIGGWNTWRRTGWPVLTPAPDATNYPKVIPRRLMYGAEDYSLAAEGVAAAVDRLGPNGDKMDSRVWWDKQ